MKIAFLIFISTILGSTSSLAKSTYSRSKILSSRIGVEAVNMMTTKKLKSVGQYYLILSKLSKGETKKKYEVLARKTQTVPFPSLKFLRPGILEVADTHLPQKVEINLYNRQIKIGKTVISPPPGLSGPDLYAYISLVSSQALAPKNVSLFDVFIPTARAENKADPFALWRTVLKDMPEDRSLWSKDQNWLYDQGRKFSLIGGAGLGGLLGMSIGEMGGAAVTARLGLGAAGGLIGLVLAAIFYPTAADAATPDLTTYECGKSNSGSFVVHYTGGARMKVTANGEAVTNIAFEHDDYEPVNCPVSNSTNGQSMACSSSKFTDGVPPEGIASILEGASSFAGFCSSPNRAEMAPVMAELMMGNNQSGDIIQIQATPAASTE